MFKVSYSLLCHVCKSLRGNASLPKVSILSWYKHGPIVMMRWEDCDITGIRLSNTQAPVWGWNALGILGEWDCVIYTYCTMTTQSPVSSPEQPNSASRRTETRISYMNGYCADSFIQYERRLEPSPSERKLLQKVKRVLKVHIIAFFLLLIYSKIIYDVKLWWRCYFLLYIGGGGGGLGI